jgi:recombination protein RecT
MSQASNPPTGAPVRDLKAIQEAGKQVAKEAGGTLVRDFFAANKSAIAAVLPKHITPEWMTGVALRALRTNPKLLEADISSLFAATITCAQLGLEPNGPQRHIWLIPFWNGKRKKTEVQVIPGYAGLIELALRSGKIRSIYAMAVYSNDPFDIEYGLDTKLKHIPFLGGERGNIIGAYAVAQYVDGGSAFEYMTVSQIERIRDNAKGYQDALMYAKRGQLPNSPWVHHFEEMARKTVVRRLCKWLPMSVELAKAVLADEMGDRGRVANFADVIDGIAYSKPDEDTEPDEAPAPAVEAQTLPAEEEAAAEAQTLPAEEEAAAEAQTLPAEEEAAAPAVPIPLRGDRAVNPASAPFVAIAEPNMQADYRELLGDSANPFEVSGTVGPEGERYLFLDNQGQVWVGSDEAAVRQVAKDMAKAR